MIYHRVYGPVPDLEFLGALGMQGEALVDWDVGLNLEFVKYHCDTTIPVPKKTPKDR